jgi:hypothetical protein
MAGTENILFDDKNVRPTDELVFSHIGKKKDLWIDLMNHVDSNYKGSEGQWNFYNDGKRWCHKRVFKKKTLFWLTVYEGSFTVTFYFGDKAETVILSSELSQQIKDDFKTGKRYGKIRAISIPVTHKDDLIPVRQLIEIKSKFR